MNRRGVVLPELITALVLASIVAAALFVMIRAQTRLVSEIMERTSRADALRVASLVLSAETRVMAPADIYGLGPDSLATRLFRGTAIVCAVEDGLTHVRYRGVRLPDAEKDSVLIADTDEVRGLSGTRAGSRVCAQEPEIDLGLHLSGAPLRPGTVLLVFESGAYHFATRALRLRRGDEGRQPITEELLDDAATGFSPMSRAFQARIGLRSVGHAATATERAAILFPLLNQ